MQMSVVQAQTVLLQRAESESLLLLAADCRLDADHVRLGRSSSRK